MLRHVAAKIRRWLNMPRGIFRHTAWRKWHGRGGGAPYTPHCLVVGTRARIVTVAHVWRAPQASLKREIAQEEASPRIIDCRGACLHLRDTSAGGIAWRRAAATSRSSAFSSFIIRNLSAAHHRCGLAA